MAHAPFAPSSADRWLNCHGSFALSLLCPEPPEGPYAAEGTRLHDVASEWLNCTDLNALFPEADVKFLKPYLDYAQARIKQATAHAIERRVTHSALLHGTADLMLGFEAENMLEVADLKTGAGIMVDPEENNQMLAYAFLALWEAMHGTGSHVIREDSEMPKVIRLTVAQPPNEEQPIRSWDTTRERVMQWGRDATTAIESALEGGAPTNPGDWCRFCKAKAICPSLRGLALDAGVQGKPVNLTLPDLSKWLDKADQIEGFIKDLREVGHSVASAGMAAGDPQIVPGWTLKPKRATRSWADEEAVLAIARKRKIKIWQDKLMSPAMAEKAHPNMPEELIEQIVAVSSGTNLVRLKPGEASTVRALEPEAKPMDKLMANFGLLKFRS
jgi:hypothetical protein